MSREKKDKIKKCQRKKYQELVQYIKDVLKKNLFFLSIKGMNEKTLKFNNTRANKKEFHKSKQPIDLMSVNVNQIAISDKFKHSDEGFMFYWFPRQWNC